MAARTLIRSLEMEETEQDGGIKEKVVELSVQSGVSSVFTAFIAVNKEDGEAIQGPLLRRDVPAPSECYPMKTNRNSFIKCGTLSLYHFQVALKLVSLSKALLVG